MFDSPHLHHRRNPAITTVAGSFLLLSTVCCFACLQNLAYCLQYFAVILQYFSVIFAMNFAMKKRSFVTANIIKPLVYGIVILVKFIVHYIAVNLLVHIVGLPAVSLLCVFTVYAEPYHHGSIGMAQIVESAWFGISCISASQLKARYSRFLAL